jgi:hypothetical protein
MRWITVPDDCIPLSARGLTKVCGPLHLGYLRAENLTYSNRAVGSVEVDVSISVSSMVGPVVCRVNAGKYGMPPVMDSLRAVSILLFLVFHPG